MIIALDVLLLVILLLTAVLALRAIDLLTSVLLTSAYSLFVSLLFAGMLAVDVSLVETALGAGLVGLLLLAVLVTTSSDGRATVDHRRHLIAVPAIIVFVGLMLYSSTGLPDRGDPAGPTRDGIAPQYLSRSLEDTETPNVVTSLLADYRSLDTLGETVVILTAALATTLVLGRRTYRPHEEDAANDEATAGDDPDAEQEGRA